MHPYKRRLWIFSSSTTCSRLRFLEFRGCWTSWKFEGTKAPLNFQLVQPPRSLIIERREQVLISFFSNFEVVWQAENSKAPRVKGASKFSASRTPSKFDYRKARAANSKAPFIWGTLEFSFLKIDFSHFAWMQDAPLILDCEKYKKPCILRVNTVNLDLSGPVKYRIPTFWAFRWSLISFPSLTYAFFQFFPYFLSKKEHFNQVKKLPHIF